MQHVPEAHLGSRQWRKLLFLRQPFPDNYTDISFLDQLRRNTTVADYSYSKLVNDFILIAFYGSLLLLVNLNFSAIYVSLWSAHLPTIATSILSAIGLAQYASRCSDKSPLKSSVVISMLLLVFSPALRSLTSSTSSDSIWALSFMLTCINVVCHDYGLELSYPYNSVIATNLSFANAIVLASRLSSSMDAFSFLVFAIQVSILVPIYDFHLRMSRSQLHYAFMAVIFITVPIVLYRVHGLNFAICYIASIILVSFGLPFYFISLQRYKNEIQGPWDTAKPIFRTT